MKILCVLLTKGKGISTFYIGGGRSTIGIGGPPETSYRGAMTQDMVGGAGVERCGTESPARESLSRRTFIL